MSATAPDTGAGPVEPPPLVLASSSPARLELLRAAGFDPHVAPSGADEEFAAVRTEDAVAAIARRKAVAVAPRFADALVLGCDSLLDLGGTALGKPASAADAAATWRRLSGNEATLYTGHCLIDTRSGRRLDAVAATVVRFGTPSEEEIAAYVATGEPMGMAGGFGLEGRSAPFVDGVDGDPSNVVGLSLALLRRMLAELGLSVCQFWDRDAPERPGD